MNTYMDKKRPNRQWGKESKFVYVTDEELMKHLKSKGFKECETGFNDSTKEIYWKYDLCSKIHDITIPWETEKELQKYSLDRWQLSNTETE